VATRDEDSLAAAHHRRHDPNAPHFTSTATSSPALEST
jgi:hypothetical protein